MPDDRKSPSTSQYVSLGYLLQTWGLEGAIAVKLHNSDYLKTGLEKFATYRRLLVTKLDVATGLDESLLSSYTIDWVKRISKRIVLKFSEVNTVEEANALRGAHIFLSRKEMLANATDATDITNPNFNANASSITEEQAKHQTNAETHSVWFLSDFIGLQVDMLLPDSMASKALQKGKFDKTRLGTIIAYYEAGTDGVFEIKLSAIEKDQQQKNQRQKNTRDKRLLGEKTASDLKKDFQKDSLDASFSDDEHVETADRAEVDEKHTKIDSVLVPATLHYFTEINLEKKTVCLINYEELLLPANFYR